MTVSIKGNEKVGGAVIRTDGEHGELELLFAAPQAHSKGIGYAAGKDVDYTRFFDRFYREDKSHNIDAGGYGIGLSIAEHICEQYKGSIRTDWRDGTISFICDLF